MQQNIQRRCCLLVGQFVCKQRWLRTSASTSTRPLCIGLCNVLTELPVCSKVAVNNERSFWSYAHQSSRTITPLFNDERLLHAGNTANWCKKEVQTAKGQEGEGNEAEEEHSAKHMRSIAPSNFDKKILVWTGKYPSIDDVPPLVTDATLNWAKNKFRVYVNIGMAAGTFCTALVVIYFGRRRAERGESVSRMNMMRHPNQYQQHLEPQAEGSK